jgi:hypothetical protein
MKIFNGHRVLRQIARPWPVFRGFRVFRRLLGSISNFRPPPSHRDAALHQPQTFTFVPFVVPKPVFNR